MRGRQLGVSGQQQPGVRVQQLGEAQSERVTVALSERATAAQSERGATWTKAEDSNSNESGGRSDGLVHLCVCVCLFSVLLTCF